MPEFCPEGTPGCGPEEARAEPRRSYYRRGAAAVGTEVRAPCSLFGLSLWCLCGQDLFVFGAGAGAGAGGGRHGDPHVPK